MAGLDPVWVVAPDVWLGESSPVKTAWVLSRRVSGALTVSGRRLDGDGRRTFRRGLTGPIFAALT
ncbi:MAG: hypothetical protein M3478_15035, partial [Planctomycetota bacterium]|nr:hypothetical protein [Planctomycetota bacterium]